MTERDSIHIYCQAAELATLNEDLKKTKEKSYIESSMLRMYYKMRELMSGLSSEYVNEAEAIAQSIEAYEEGKVEKSEIINMVAKLIKRMEKDVNDFENQKKSNSQKSVYEQIIEPKNEEKTKIDTNNIAEVIDTLKVIRQNLEVVEDEKKIEMYMSQLAEIMVSMGKFESLEAVEEHIIGYYMNELERDLFMVDLDEFIEELENMAGEKQNADNIAFNVREEVKNACSSVWDVVKNETAITCREIGKTIKEEMPTCSKAVEHLKETPEKAKNAFKETSAKVKNTFRKKEKNFKRVLREWLFSDDDI